MAQTFDIRFARSGGLGALFEAPANSFRWKGAGRLSIDAEGISIAVKRGLASLLLRHRSQRIPAQSINEVYREGESLRVEFATDGNPRAVLPFWARDRDTAAQIMQLLPTSRTIELEYATSTPAAGNSRRNLLLGATVVLAVGVALFIGQRRAPVVANPAIVSAVKNDTAVVVPPESARPTGNSAAPPAKTAAPATSSTMGELISADEARKLAILAEDPVDWTAPPPRTDAGSDARKARLARMERSLPAAGEPEDVAFVPLEVSELPPRADEAVVRIPQTSLAYGSARQLLALFEVIAAHLSQNYRREREQFDTGILDAQQFADRLDGLETRWRDVIGKLLERRQYSDPALSEMRGTLLSVVISQRVFLTGYGAGLRASDQPRIERAFEELKRAEESLARARKYLF